MLRQPTGGWSEEETKLRAPPKIYPHYNYADYYAPAGRTCKGV